jgi:hypothetical protein
LIGLPLSTVQGLTPHGTPIIQPAKSIVCPGVASIQYRNNANLVLSCDLIVLMHSPKFVPL